MTEPSNLHRVSNDGTLQPPAIPDGFYEVLRSSEGLNWSGMTAIETDVPVGGYVYRGVNALWVQLLLSRAHILVEKNSRLNDRKGNTHSVIVNPHGAADSVEVFVHTAAFHLLIDFEIVGRVAEQIYSRPLSGIELSYAYGADDPSLHHLLKTVQHHLEQPDHAPWCIDYLSRAIAAHVLGKHARQRNYAPNPESMAALSDTQMQRVEEFLQSNLEGNFKFEQLGASIGLSRTLFFERFRRSTNLSPNQYLQLLRVERAKQLLRDGRLPMAEIALISGFPDQAYMNRIFGRVTGTTPGRYRTDHQ